MSNYKTKEQRKKEAEERQLKYQGLTLQQRIENLNKRLGYGVGAVKERSILRKIIGDIKKEEK